MIWYLKENLIWKTYVFDKKWKGRKELNKEYQGLILKLWFHFLKNIFWFRYLQCCLKRFNLFFANGLIKLSPLPMFLFSFPTLPEAFPNVTWSLWAECLYCLIIVWKLVKMGDQLKRLFIGDWGILIQILRRLMNIRRICWYYLRWKRRIWRSWANRYCWRCSR